MKKFLIAIGIILGLFIAVLIILPFFIDINAIVAGQIPVIEKQIHRKITIGKVSLTVLTGLGAEIRDVSISNHPDFKKQDFVNIKKLKAAVQLLPLLKKEVLISSVSIDKPSVIIERNARGVMNFSDMFAPATGENKTPKKPDAPETKGPLAALENIQISKIFIKDGNFKFLDAFDTKASKEIQLDKLNLAMKAVSLSQKINFNLDTDVYAGPKAGHVALLGDVGPIGNTLIPEDIPIDLTLALDNINLPHLASYIKGARVQSGSLTAKASLKGRLKDKLHCRIGMEWDNLNMMSGDAVNQESSAPRLAISGPWQIEADISGPPKAPAVAGKITLDKSAIQYEKLFDKPTDTPLNADFKVAVKEDALRIDGLKVVLNKMTLSASADVEHFADPFIDGKASIAAAPLDALSPILPMLKTYELQGTIELSDAKFKGKIDELKNLKGVSGSLTINNGSAVSAELGKKIEKIQASIDIADNAIQIKNTSFQIDKSDLDINATIRNPMKPDISFNLASSYLDVDSLLPAPSGEKKTAEAKKDTSVEPPAKAEAPEKKNAPDLKASGKASIKKCIYNKLVLDNVTAELQYADAVAILKNLSFDTFGGNISADAKANISDMRSPLWSVDLATRNINANAALSQFTSMKDTFYGNFNGKLALQGKGADWPSISKTLAGNGSVDIANGKLATINVLDAVSESLLKFKGLGLLAQSVSPESRKHLNETNFDELSGKFNIANEKIQVKDMTMSSPDFKLTGAGDIGFDKSLDFTTLLVLSKSASARLQKDNVMKYLLNKDQQVEIPCAVKGDVASPRITANGESLNRLLENAATDALKEQIQKKIEDKLGNDAGKLLKGIFK